MLFQSRKHLYAVEQIILPFSRAVLTRNTYRFYEHAWMMRVFISIFPVYLAKIHYRRLSFVVG